MGIGANEAILSSDKIFNCNENSDTIFLAPYPNSFEKAEQFCSNINGFLPLPRNLSHLNEIFANREQFNTT